MPVIALIIGVLLAAVDQIIKYFVLTYLQPVGSVKFCQLVLLPTE